MGDAPAPKATDYPDRYTPELLHAVPRATGRSALGIGLPLPFEGVDLWTAYELTWLDDGGRPVVAVLSLTVPADTPRLIESKSLKLYLNSFAMSRYASSAAIAGVIGNDLTQAAGGNVTVDILPAAVSQSTTLGGLPGHCIDYEDTTCDRYDVDAALLETGDGVVSEALQSHLLRSLCPLTGQPDTGSLLLNYRGPRIDRRSLLRYLTSFRRHRDFHELCVERIFVDVQDRCRPQALTVYARYNRRGGIDINPFRSDFEKPPAGLRLWRQ